MFDDLHNSSGERLDASFHPGAGDAGPDLLVLGHGVTANKDRPFLVTLAEAAAASGLHVLRFSFAGNGASEGRFEEATITKEVEDLTAVLERCADFRVTYAGHSMGGAVGVLAAERDARIRRLVSLAGMVRTEEFAQRKFGELTPGADCMWDKPECPLSQAYMDDMQRIDSVLESCARVSVPWLLVHGKDDTVVPFQDSVDAHERAPGPKALVALDGADHVFSDGADRPMADAVVSWLRATPAPG